MPLSLPMMPEIQETPKEYSVLTKAMNYIHLYQQVAR